MVLSSVPETGMEEKTRVKETRAEEFMPELVFLLKLSLVSFRGAKVVLTQANLVYTQVYPTSHHGLLLKYAMWEESIQVPVRFAEAKRGEQAAAGLQTVLTAIRKRPPLPTVQEHRVRYFASK